MVEGRSEVLDPYSVPPSTPLVGGVKDGFDRHVGTAQVLRKEGLFVVLRRATEATTARSAES